MADSLVSENRALLFPRKARGSGLVEGSPHSQCKLHTAFALVFVSNREEGRSCKHDRLLVSSRKPPTTDEGLCSVLLALHRPSGQQGWDTVRLSPILSTRSLYGHNTETQHCLFHCEPEETGSENIRFLPQSLVSWTVEKKHKPGKEFKPRVPIPPQQCIMVSRTGSLN